MFINPQRLSLILTPRFFVEKEKKVPFLFQNRCTLAILAVPLKTTLFTDEIKGFRFHQAMLLLYLDIYGSLSSQVSQGLHRDWRMGCKIL